jgi:hypothetical protein
MDEFVRIEIPRTTDMIVAEYPLKFVLSENVLSFEGPIETIMNPTVPPIIRRIAVMGCSII